jgi:hypothetical protein
VWNAFSPSFLGSLWSNFAGGPDWKLESLPIIFIKRPVGLIRKSKDNGDLGQILPNDCEVKTTSLFSCSFFSLNLSCLCFPLPSLLPFDFFSSFYDLECCLFAFYLFPIYWPSTPFPNCSSSIYVLIAFGNGPKSLTYFVEGDWRNLLQCV